MGYSRLLEHGGVASHMLLQHFVYDPHHQTYVLGCSVEWMPLVVGHCSLPS